MKHGWACVVLVIHLNGCEQFSKFHYENAINSYKITDVTVMLASLHPQYLYIFHLWLL